MTSDSQRLHALDLVRGVAVVVMVLGHSIDAVLSSAERTTEVFRLYDAVRGFTAPVFLLVSGVAFTVATERKWDDYRRPGRPLTMRLLRVALLFLIGYALHFPFFSLAKLLNGTTPQDRAAFLQVDVLHCVAASLLLLQAVVLTSATPQIFARRAAVLAAGTVLLSPLLWGRDLASAISPVVAPYLNMREPSIFPVLPYGAFFFSGAVAGHGLLRARAANREPQFLRYLSFAGISAIALGILLEHLPVTLFPPHDYWKASPNFFMVRTGVVLVILSLFFSARGVPGSAGRHIVTLGQASLLVYVVHLIIVYGSAANQGLAQLLGRTSGPAQAAGIGVMVLLAMLGLVHGWNVLRSGRIVPPRVVHLALVSSLLFLFVMNPY